MKSSNIASHLHMHNGKALGILVSHQNKMWFKLKVLVLCSFIKPVFCNKPNCFQVKIWRKQSTNQTYNLKYEKT